MDATPRNVAVVGAGYVGLATAVTLAHLGHNVTCVDTDAAKVAALANGVVPIHEPGMQPLMAASVAAGRLRFSTDLAPAVRAAGFVFICVGTPMSPSGAAEMKYVEAAARGIGAALDGAYRVIVNKSTVPVGTGDWTAGVVQSGFVEHNEACGFAPDYDVVSCPEFLREGTALADSFYPDRIVIGTRSERAVEEMQELYAPIISGAFEVPGLQPPPHHRLPVPVIVTDTPSAEMIKLAANAFLAAKISFINEMARLCERVGADVTEVARGIGADARIGYRFLNAGLGWGGSCFGKDLAALDHLARALGEPPGIVRAAMDINASLRDAAIRKLERELGPLEGKTVGLLGLAFKPNTDDLRDAPSLDIARRLRDAGATVRAFDPVAMPNAARQAPWLEMAADPYALAVGADALLLVTEWPAFATLDLARLHATMRTPVFVDGRNVFQPAQMTAAGFRYSSFGR
jgi:UDPglucose 6-dehydrogenase